MRPIERGVAPRSYTNYQNAIPDLVDRIGDYCCYCERHIETNLAVEHINPKSRVPELTNEWTNFLLGCINCNSCKGKKEVNVDDYLWPDTDNTIMAFDYLDGRIVSHSSLTKSMTSKALALLELCGLDKEPGHPNKKKRPTSKDRRWRRRLDVWDIAQRNLQKLQANDSVEVRELIVENALARGMFSIWMQVFAIDSDMRCRFVKGFKGTATDCFDNTGCPLSRLGGKV